MLLRLLLAVAVLGLAVAYSGGVPYKTKNVIDISSGGHSQSSAASGGGSSVIELLACLRKLHLKDETAPEECPPGWRHHLDSCYLIPAQTSTWHMAHHHCALIEPRARLASVHGSSSKFIEDMVTKFSAEMGVWVGLATQKSNTGWFWSDGTGTDYLDWDRAEPSQADDKELCVHLGWPGYDGKHHFHDNWCTFDMNMLCQISLK